MVEAAHFTSLLRSDTRRRCTCCAFRRSRYQRMVHSDAMTAYAELHCHSAYSFLDGASPPDALLAAAHSLDYPALALTDRNGIYGSLAFAHAVDTVAVGEGQGRIVEAVRCGEQCVGRRRSVEEGVG